ncbi:UNVERIFIED_CONTAM: hypothetical protein GTU68_013009 [Idotea baltica]|nr:hypothetical protein [Idotea baltica]
MRKLHLVYSFLIQRKTSNKLEL